MQTIRVAQIVDSLLPGGTESVAVNLANDLAEESCFLSYLICSRGEGELKQRIKPGVTYLSLNKKRSLDLPALWRLLQFIRKHKINIIHAHSTSFFFPVLIKRLCSFKLVWHDHYGLDVPVSGKRIYPYIFFSHFFDYAISVNERLLNSNRKHLHIGPQQQSYLPNYSVSLPVSELPEMKGLQAERLICLANLRPQKDHLTLLTALRLIKDVYPSVTLYCVGIGEADAYETEVRQLTKDLELDDNVVFTGSVSNPFSYLQQCSIGVLSSSSEGLPLSLIEYGLAGLSVVCTRVGQCAELLQDGKNGLLVEPQNAVALAEACIQLLKDENLKRQLAVNFTAFVRNHYSKQAILHRLISIYKSIN
jgi:glycosyltransferase involved in cell wall biosynthesis